MRPRCWVPSGWVSFRQKRKTIFYLSTFVKHSTSLIDHNVLFNKLLSSGVPEHIIAWSLDFLNGRRQFVKTGDSVSTTTTVAAGTPQGTVSGPNDFKVIINDLTFNTTYAKYVDDNCSVCISGCKRLYTSL